MTDDDQFMRAALALGEEALRMGQLPVGAVVVHNGEIVGRGHKRMSRDPYFEHAEIEAMRAALKRPAGPAEKRSRRALTLYATLEPCIMCFGTALHAQLGRIVYALEDPGGGATGLDTASLPSRQRRALPEVVGGVLREEAVALFRRFIKTTTNPYWRNPSNPLLELLRGSPLPPG